MLSDDSESEDELNQLTINEHFAKAYELKKEREELTKLKEKYGSDAGEDDEDEEDSEEAESEDEDGEELTPAVDAAILRTLARIKKKDPSIYEQGKDVFDEEIKKSGDLRSSSRAGKEKEQKPLTIRQHALHSVLNPTSRTPSPEPLTHIKEQEILRHETIAAFHTAVDAGDEEEDDLLVLREKTKDELEREEEEYRAFLQREVGEDLGQLIRVDADDEAVAGSILHDEHGGRAEKKKKHKKKSKAKDNVQNREEKDQEFLVNYILNRGWIDRSAKRLPTYKEITGGGKGKARAGSLASADDQSEGEASEPRAHSDAESEGDEDFDEVAELFEKSYNFRFEEPGASQIARFPRNVGETVRREESHRKEVRERRKERKEQEKQTKKEEVKRLKSLKMKEIRERLERIGKEGGKKVEDTEALQELDLEGDWDPDAHDAQMSKIYGDDDDEGAFDEFSEKPIWADDIDITDIAPEAGPSEKKSKKKKKKKKGTETEEGGVDVDEMDADVLAAAGEEEEWDGTEEMRKQKLDQYMDELYELEFNDMVGDMPTRFRYTKVQPQSFALTPVEILLAKDSELNQYVGLRKLAPYRKEGAGWDKDRSAKLKELKTTLQERKAAIGVDDDGSKFASDRPAKKRKGKKERMKEKAKVEEAGVDLDEAEGGEAKDEPVSKKRKTSPDAADVNEVESEAAPPKARRRRHKKSGKHSEST